MKTIIPFNTTNRIIFLGVAVLLLFCPLRTWARDGWCISDRHRVAAQITEAFNSFSVTGPVAASDIRSGSGLEQVAYHLGQFVAGALHQNRIPTVEIDKELLKQIEYQLVGQMGPMIDQNTAVEIGKWVAARYLLFGSVSRVDHSAMAAYHYRLVDLETRRQLAIGVLDFGVHDCNGLALHRQLPPPSPGNGNFLPEPQPW